MKNPEVHNCPDDPFFFIVSETTGKHLFLENPGIMAFTEKSDCDVRRRPARGARAAATRTGETPTPNEHETARPPNAVPSWDVSPEVV